VTLSAMDKMVGDALAKRLTDAFPFGVQISYSAWLGGTWDVEVYDSPGQLAFSRGHNSLAQALADAADHARKCGISHV